MQLTDWYSPDQKPTRRGVYITRKNDNIYFQYWTGTFWNVRMSNIEKASQTKQRSQHQDVHWKGILK